MHLLLLGKTMADKEPATIQDALRRTEAKAKKEQARLKKNLKVIETKEERVVDSRGVPKLVRTTIVEMKDGTRRKHSEWISSLKKKRK